MLYFLPLPVADLANKSFHRSSASRQEIPFRYILKEETNISRTLDKSRRKDVSIQVHWLAQILLPILFPAIDCFHLLPQNIRVQKRGSMSSCVLSIIQSENLLTSSYLWLDNIICHTNRFKVAESHCFEEFSLHAKNLRMRHRSDHFNLSCPSFYDSAPLESSI